MPHTRALAPFRMDRRALLRGGIAVAASSALPWRSAHPGGALSITGDAVELSGAAIADLEKSLAGIVILPTSPDYDQARRVWSPAYNRRPALIARCTSKADVQAAVQFARSHKLLTAVRCGGHCSAGFSMIDDGFVIDLSPFNHVQVEADRKVAYVSGGALLGNLDRATAPHRLATTAGVVSHTGVGGLATAAGQGRLARKFGLTIDNNRGVEMVLADGSIVRANANENPDLYWAVRGGGGNFGIVTQFELQLHDFDQVVTSFSYRFPAAKAKDVFRLYVDLCEKAPRELTLGAGLQTTDGGETSASLSGTFLGPIGAAEAATSGVKALGTPTSTRSGEMSYITLQSIGDGPRFSDVYSYGKSGFFNQVDLKLIDTLVDYTTRNSVPGTRARISQQGGAIAEVPETATAFAQRDGVYQASIGVDWGEGKDPGRGIKHVRDLWSLLEPMSTHGFYINSLYDDSEERVRKSFRGNLARLVDIKTQVDPANFFRLNPNIRPSRGLRTTGRPG
jgi:hypothetical protein